MLQHNLPTAWLVAAEFKGQKCPLMLCPSEGMEKQNTFLGTALLCKPSIQLSKHQEITQAHLQRIRMKEDDSLKNCCCGTTNVSMETFQPLVKEGRNAVSFLLLSKLHGLYGGWHLSRYLRDGAAMVTQLVFLRETMTCNTMHHPSEESRKKTDVNDTSQRSLGTWQEEDSSCSLHHTTTQAKLSLTGTSTPFAHPMIFALLGAKLYSCVYVWGHMNLH